MTISRRFKCFAGCCWFAGLCDALAHEVVIEAPVGKVIGYAKQRFSILLIITHTFKLFNELKKIRKSLWKAHFEVYDEYHNPIFKILGPPFIFDGPFLPKDNEFKVNSTFFSMYSD